MNPKLERKFISVYASPQTLFSPWDISVMLLKSSKFLRIYSKSINIYYRHIELCQAEVIEVILLQLFLTLCACALGFVLIFMLHRIQC